MHLNPINIRLQTIRYKPCTKPKTIHIVFYGKFSVFSNIFPLSFAYRSTFLDREFQPTSPKSMKNWSTKSFGIALLPSHVHHPLRPLSVRESFGRLGEAGQLCVVLNVSFGYHQPTSLDRDCCKKFLLWGKNILKIGCDSKKWSYLSWSSMTFYLDTNSKSIRKLPL